MKLIWGLYFLLKAIGSSCHTDVKQGFVRASHEYKVKKIGRFDARVHETSGVVRLPDGTYLAHGDSGCASTVYHLDANGNMLDSLEFNLPNRDWEELAADTAHGRFFIADTGNNRNKRRDLRIFAYHKGEHMEVDTLHLSYADQTAFPPMEDSLRFDCEAVVWEHDHLHLFSKNRGKDWAIRHYTLPDAPGSYTLPPLADQVILHKSMVTSAAISTDEKLLALLTYGKVFLFDVSKGVSLNHPYQVIKYPFMGQSESITFINETDWVVVNEEGKMFEFKKKYRSKK
jgi:hypothetical protein